MKKIIPVIILQLIISIVNGQSPTRIYVDQNAAGSLESGLDWANAFLDLQGAIAVAQYGDTIWVAQGIYHPTEDNDRTVSFELRNGVTILGGFNGTEWYEWQRDPELYETVLSGEIGNPADSTDNSMHVLYTLGTDENTVLDGFTITRGFAYQLPGETNVGPYNVGAGLYVDVNADYPYARPRIRRCRFMLNTARLGGGIYCYGVGGNRWADPVIMDCVFELNYAVTNGGAIYKEGESPLGGGLLFTGADLTIIPAYLVVAPLCCRIQAGISNCAIVVLMGISQWIVVGPFIMNRILGKALCWLIVASSKRTRVEEVEHLHLRVLNWEVESQRVSLFILVTACLTKI